MSGHDIHPSTEQKPVSFTVPLILAIVAIVIIVLLVSVCDPKTGHSDLQENHSHLQQSHQNNADAATGTAHESDTNAPEAAGAHDQH